MKVIYPLGVGYVLTMYSCGLSMLEEMYVRIATLRYMVRSRSHRLAQKWHVGKKKKGMNFNSRHTLMLNILYSYILGPDKDMHLSGAYQSHVTNNT
jgi:hypothetical protein